MAKRMNKSEASAMGCFGMLLIIIAPFLWLYERWGWWAVAGVIGGLLALFVLWLLSDSSTQKQEDVAPPVPLATPVTRTKTPEEIAAYHKFIYDREVDTSIGIKSSLMNSRGYVPIDVFSQQMMDCLSCYDDFNELRLPFYIDEQDAFSHIVETLSYQVRYVVKGRSVNDMDAAADDFFLHYKKLDFSQITPEAHDFFAQFHEAFHHVWRVARIVNPAANHLRAAAELVTDGGKKKRVIRALDGVLSGLAEQADEPVFVNAKKIIEALDTKTESLLLAAKALTVVFEFPQVKHDLKPD